MSDLLACSFSAPEAALHSAGVEGAQALVISDGRPAAPGPLQVLDADPRAGRWTVAAQGAWEVEFEAIGEPVSFDGARREWLCRVSGTAPLAGEERPLHGVGRVALEAPSIGRAELRRSVWMAFGDEVAFLLAAERPPRASGHGQELLSAFVLRGADAVASPVSDPRLSSSYGADGRLLRAGLELWQDDEHDDHALRIGAETLAAGELELAAGKLVRSVAFLVCHHHGREGIGCYEITRAAQA